MYQILIVEDDEDVANITRLNLEHAGYSTAVAANCAQAKDLLRAADFDLILLDMMLPDGDGLDLCEQIRKNNRCPIIFITCLDSSGTVVDAFGKGGDDYVVKPVKYDELLARIAAHLRRAASTVPAAKDAAGPHRYRSFALDKVRRLVVVEGRDVELSVIEFALLKFMADNPNTLLLYEELYSAVWENDSLGDVRTVMVHISNLRKKVDPEKRGIIQTVRGAGYVFSDV